jgi:ABC-type nitrate/sulfonate/bicarbonate transport system substrate-binding protein
MNQVTRKLAAVLVSAVAVIGVASCSSSGSPATATAEHGGCSSYTTFPIGTTHTLSDSPVIVADNLGYFARYCIKVDYVTELSSADQISTLASSRIWAIGLSWVPAMYTAAEQGIDFKVVADKAGVNAEHGAYGVVVATKYAVAGGSACPSLEAAKGQGFGIASTTDQEVSLMDTFLKRCNLSMSDFKVTVLPFAAQAAALQNGAIGVAAQAEPDLTPLVQTGKAVYLTPNVGSVFGDASISIGPLVFGPYLENPAHRQLAQDIIDAYTLGVRAYENAVIKNVDKTKILQMIATQIKIPLSLLRQMHLPYFDPNDFTVPAVYKQVAGFAQSVETYYVAHGEISKSQAIPVAQMFDLAFARNAVKQFGIWTP